MPPYLDADTPGRTSVLPARPTDPTPPASPSPTPTPTPTPAAGKGTARSPARRTIAR